VRCFEVLSRGGAGVAPDAWCDALQVLDVEQWLSLAPSEELQAQLLRSALGGAALNADAMADGGCEPFDGEPPGTTAARHSLHSAYRKAVRALCCASLQAHLPDASELLLRACMEPSAGALFGSEPVVLLWEDVHEAVRATPHLGCAEFITFCSLCHDVLLELRVRGCLLTHTRLCDAAAPLWDIIATLATCAVAELKEGRDSGVHRDGHGLRECWDAVAAALKPWMVCHWRPPSGCDDLAQLQNGGQGDAPWLRDQPDLVAAVLQVVVRVVEQLRVLDSDVLGWAATSVLTFMHDASFSDVHLFLLAPEGLAPLPWALLAPSAQDLAAFVEVARSGNSGSTQALWEILSAMHFFSGAVGFEVASPRSSPRSSCDFGGGLEAGAEDAEAQTSSADEYSPLQVVIGCPATQPGALDHPAFFVSLFELLLLWVALQNEQCVAYLDVVLSLPWGNAGTKGYSRMVQLTDELIPLGSLISEVPDGPLPTWVPRALRFASAMLEAAGGFGKLRGPGKPHLAPAVLERYCEYLRISVFSLKHLQPVEARNAISGFLGQIAVLYRASTGNTAAMQMMDGMFTTLLSVVDASPLLQRVDLVSALRITLPQHPSLAIPMLQGCFQAIVDPASLTALSNTCVLVALEAGAQWNKILATVSGVDGSDFPQLCINSNAALSLTAWELHRAWSSDTMELRTTAAAAVLDLVAVVTSFSPPTHSPHHLFLLWSLMVVRGATECSEALSWTCEALPHIVERLRDAAAAVPLGTLGALLGGSEDELPYHFRLVAGFMACFIAHRCIESDDVQLAEVLGDPARPDYEPAIQNALALVDDDGLPLSHISLALEQILELTYPGPEYAWISGSLRAIHARHVGQL